VLAEQLYSEFATVQLLQPFEASLQAKQQLMDAVIQALNGLVEYEIAEVTAAATFYIAETYFEFSRALMESQRPDDLQAAELAEYELVLEEEAFPFEERAIAMHEQNLGLLHDGVYNSWTTRSLGELAGLVPGRYARGELRLREPFVVESILGTTFSGEVVEATTFGPYTAIIPQISGAAHIVGRSEWLSDPRDPLRNGFLLR
jgi:hypothetical protein